MTTPVEFHFVTPDGTAIANAEFEIHLSQSGFDLVIDGVVMPRMVTATTDSTGRATVNLWTTPVAYIASMVDPVSDVGLRYKFYVPDVAAGVTVRLQDIVVPYTTQDVPYVDLVYQLIQTARNDTEAARAQAQDWATKTDAPVAGGTTYGAKKYAQDTAADRVQTGLDRIQTGLDRTQTGADAVATNSSRVAAALSEQNAAQAATSAINVAGTNGSWPNGAGTNVPRGILQSGVGAITPGAGGTNGTYALAFSGGTGWTGPGAAYPSGTFTVAGNVVTAVTMTNPGLCLSATPVVPTVSFAACPGLTGAAVALTAAFLVSQGYYVTSLDGLQLDFYRNVGGVATRDTTVASIVAAPSVASLLAKPLPGTDFAMQDQSGNGAFVVQSGVHKFSAAEAETFNGLKRTELARRLRRANLFFSADLVHHIMYGQSLSLGNGGGFNFLPSEYFDCLRFNANGTIYAGPRAQEGTGTEAQNHSSLVAYEEQPHSGNTTPTGNGETALGPAMRMVKQLLIDEDGITPSMHTYRLLGSAPGLSNTAISGLGQGSMPYNRLIADVTYALARAQEQNWTYAVDVIYWFHGERDIQDGTTRTAYLNALRTLYQNLNADIKAITGQAHDIVMIGYQCTFAGGTNNIALAQLDYAKENSKYILATGVYVAEHFDAVNVHLAGTGYPHMGAYCGLAYKRCVIEGGTWPTMYPRRLFRNPGSKVLLAEFPDTGFPLAFSTTFFAQVANQGFSVVGVDGVTDNPIVSVSLSGRIVRIVLTNALPGKLRYGFLNGGWGGNLHDTCTIDPGMPQEVPLYLPCLTFEESFA